MLLDSRLVCAIPKHNKSKENNKISFQSRHTQPQAHHSTARSSQLSSVDLSDTTSASQATFSFNTPVFSSFSQALARTRRLSEASRSVTRPSHLLHQCQNGSTQATGAKKTQKTRFLESACNVSITSQHRSVLFAIITLHHTVITSANDKKNTHPRATFTPHSLPQRPVAPILYQSDPHCVAIFTNRQIAIRRQLSCHCHRLSRAQEGGASNSASETNQIKWGPQISAETFLPTIRILAGLRFGHPIPETTTARPCKTE